jgi:O-antigen/teichoic acid export membrane protein
MHLRRFIARLSAASLSPVGEFLLRFLRTIVLSRLLSPDDLGVAVVLMSIMTSCEVITDVGLDKFVMRSRDYDRAQVIAAARQISVARAVLLAAAITLLASPLAAAFGASDQHRVVVWLAIVPLIGSLRNWRIVQIQQDYRYGAETIANIGSRVAALLAVLPAYLLFHDARTMLVSLVVEATVFVALSYVVAPRERAVAINPAIRREALGFGLPLMANGVGLVVLRQLDQVIVANLFGLATLAHYTLALNLAIIPTSVLQRIGGKLLLPFLGRSRGDHTKSKHAALIAILVTTAAAAALAVPVGLSLDFLVPRIYGAQYQVSPEFAALAMCVAFLRFCRGGPNGVLLDQGQTMPLTVGNMIGAVGLLVGLLLGLATHRLETVLVGLVIGDLVSFLLLIGLMRRLVPLSTALRHIAVLTAVVASAAAGMWIDGHPGWLMRGCFLAVSLLAIGGDCAVIYIRIIAPYLGGRASPVGEDEAAAVPTEHATAAPISIGHGT